MKPTKKDVKKVTKKKVTNKKETNQRRKEDTRIRDLEEVVVGMGAKLNVLESLYKKVKQRLGIWCYYPENILEKLLWNIIYN